jgi:hypothetical protein
MNIKHKLVIAAVVLASLVPSRGSLLDTFLSQSMQDSMDAFLLGTNAANGVSIVQQPIGLTTLPGANLLLAVGATGPNLHYQWTVNGDVIPAGTNAILPLNNIIEDICGAYRVTVFNNVDMDWSTNAYVQILSPTLTFANNFTNRNTITAASGTGSGTTMGAWNEYGEPKPASGWYFNTVWLTWVAPQSGLAEMDTVGSGFDSWLGVYTGTLLTNLTAIATDDDSGGLHTSYVRFNAQANVSYQIMVAARNYGGGPLAFNWSLTSGKAPFPTITASPTNLTSTLGSPASLSVQFNSQVPATIRWYHNGLPITGATQNTLQWSQLKLSDLGTYQVSLTATNNWVVNLDPVDIQFNSEGLGSVGARNKLTDAVNSGLVGQ